MAPSSLQGRIHGVPRTGLPSGRDRYAVTDRIATPTEFSGEPVNIRGLPPMTQNQPDIPELNGMTRPERHAAASLAGIVGLRMFGLLLILPVIIRTTEEAIIAVPLSYREASFGLGASRLYTIWRVILPAAMPGIVTSLILSIGRIVGESAPVFLTAGMVARIPESVFDSGRTLTVHLYMLTTELYTQHDWNMAFATATVLVLVVLGINLVTKFITNKFSKATY